ncbi:hypothetical protein Bca101_059418 [Brassica carinata]
MYDGELKAKISHLLQSVSRLTRLLLAVFIIHHARDHSCGCRNRHRFSRRSKRKLDRSNSGELLIIYNIWSSNSCLFSNLSQTSNLFKFLHNYPKTFNCTI